MNVGELKKLLNEYSDDLLIIASRDEEGNGFAELYGAGLMMWDNSEGEVFVMDDQIGSDGYTEEDRAPDGSVAALVLWP